MHVMKIQSFWKTVVVQLLHRYTLGYLSKSLKLTFLEQFYKNDTLYSSENLCLSTGVYCIASIRRDKLVRYGYLEYLNSAVIAGTFASNSIKINGLMCHIIPNLSPGSDIFFSLRRGFIVAFLPQKWVSPHQLEAVMYTKFWISIGNYMLLSVIWE